MNLLKLPLASPFHFVVAVVAGLLSTALLADDSTWTGGGTGDSWATQENWEDDIIPGATTGFTNQDTATFGTTGAGTVEVDAGRNLLSLIFPADESGGYTFTGEDLHLSHGGLISQSHTQDADNVFNNHLVLHAPNTTSAGQFEIRDSANNRSFVFAGGISAGQTSETVTLSVTGNNRALSVFSGVLADHATEGTLALHIDHGAVIDGGTTFLSGANTFSGGTTVDSGSVNFDGNSNAFGIGDLIWNGGRIHETNATIDNNLVINGTISMVSSGVTFDGDVSLGTAAAISANGGTQTFNGVISDGTGTTFTRVSAGVIVLNAANTFTGGFIMDTATNRRVELGHDQALGTGTLVIHGGQFGGDNRTIANAVEWNGEINFVNTTYTFTGPIALGNDAGNNPTLSANGATRTFDGVISDGSVAGKTLTITGLGRHIFNAENTFTGGVTTSALFLQLGDDQALGTGTLTLLGHGDPAQPTRIQVLEKNIGTINVVNDIVLDARNDTVYLQNAPGWNFDGTLTLGSEDGLTPTLNFDGGNTAVFHGVVSSGDPDAVFTKEGTGTIAFANNNTITGDIVVDGGTLQIGNGGATGLIGTAAVTLEDGTTLRFDRTGTYTAGNDIDGEGDLEIQGGGNATFSGALTHEGTTTVTGSSAFRVDGSFNGGNGISVASGSTLGGAGSIGVGDNSITLASGSFLFPGSLNTPGTLNISMSAFGTMDLSALAEFGTDNFIFRLDSVSDSVAVTGGTVTFGFGNLGWADFDFILGSGFGPGTYTLFSSDGGLLGSLDATATEGVLDGFDSFLTLDGNDLMLTVIPEPGTVAAILGALALGLVAWRRRQSRRFEVGSGGAA